ncbi:hypothetical protein F8388_011966 [Cannabis sativa]|uniref:Cysteine-rich transmembrane domain-containing protein n=1 Tax=Cannabis sativa TaxID=3483 RepID=A0A7J6GDN5_CANSA|nr:hypothetical protein G4B88_024949 [Cannabis sativa]KAF4381044.1 hypothetical protein F8388_011966 [Cannabis sativa]
MSDTKNAYVNPSETYQGAPEIMSTPQYPPNNAEPQKEPGFLEECLAALCCCCTMDECCCDPMLYCSG